MTSDISAIAGGWAEEFRSALIRRDASALSAMFMDDASWRDVLGFGWRIDTVAGRADIERAFAAKLGSAEPQSFGLAQNRPAPHRVRRIGVDTIEAFVDFQTATGTGSGVVRLVRDPSDAGRYKAWILMTALNTIHGVSPWSHMREGEDEVSSRDFGGENWADKRRRAYDYDDREPRVLVVGAGQAGLSIAAQLGALGIDTLVIDRHDEVGDNWRKRYHSLALHNEIYGNHLPFMPFPPSFPRFVPKDKLGDWFKAYAESLDLNVWTRTALDAGSYDAAERRWDVRVNRDGVPRNLHPRHIVFATGVSAIPIHPRLPGLDTFAGTIVHSGAFDSGHDWAGKNAVVLGTGNSAHDVAQDLQACGAHVSMVQRSSTTILSLKEAQKLYALYTEGHKLEDADLLALAVPYPMLVKSYQQVTAAIRQADHALLSGLEARGFRLDFGEDGTGFQMKYLTRGGGYYFNVGASDLIVAGKIGLIQFASIERFVPEGILMKNGAVHPVDLLVTATGFKNQQDVVRSFLGDDIADRIGPVWGFGDQMELRNMWQRTPQDGLWFNAGSLTQCRIFSKYLALQIKACEMGLIV